MEDTEKTAMNLSSIPSDIPRWRLILDQERITLDVLNEAYDGQGTHESPYIVTWIEKDPGNPLQWSNGFRWWICAINALVTLAVALNSSAFSGKTELHQVFFSKLICGRIPQRTHRTIRSIHRNHHTGHLAFRTRVRRWTACLGSPLRTLRSSDNIRYQLRGIHNVQYWRGQRT